MAQFIGTISKVTGAVYVQAADGSRRPVKVGDDLFQGDLLVRSDGSVVEVSFADSTPLVMTGSGELLISAELIEEGRNTAADSALFDETLDAVVAALEGEGDLLDELEATAAGGVGNEGSSFVRLGRIGYGLEELILRVAASQGQQVSPENADFDNDLQLLQPLDVEPVTPPIVTAPPETPPPEPPVTPPPENGPPDAVDDTTVTDYQTPVNVTVLGNDSDPDGDALTVVDNSEPSNGSAVLNEDGTFTYTPDDGFTGTDSFTYTITDGNGGEDTATVTIEVGEAPPPPPPLPPENGPPDAVDDTTVTDYQTSVKVTVLGNDSDPDGDALTVVDNSEPSNGSAVLNEDGTFTYTPDDGFTGTDSFTYTITDGNGGEDTATVTIEVGGAPPPPPPPPENGPPDAVDDTTVTDYQTPVNVTVLGNDSDPDGDALTVVDNSEPSNGSAVLNEDGTFTYTPDDGFTGTDSFTYTITDGNGGEDTATVTIEVGEAPPPPPPVEAVVELSGDASVVEADGALLEHTISLVDENGNPLVLADGETITLTLSYTTIDGVDGIESEDLSTQQVTITLTGNGSDSSFTVSNVVADDALAEGTEGYTVSIASVDGGTNSFGSVTISETTNSGTGQITDETNPPDDPENPPDVGYTLALFAVVDGEYVSANAIAETDGVGTYVVLAVDGNGDPLAAEDQPGGTVDVAVADGTATRTDDYSTDATRTVTVGTEFTIAAVSDEDVEENETFTLSLEDGTWSNDGAYEEVVYQGTVTTTIVDDDTPPDFSDVGSWFFSGTADEGGVNTIRVNEDATGNDGNVATLGVQFNTGNKDGGGSGGTDELPDGAVITVYIEITDDSLVNASLSFGASKNGNKVSGHSAEIQTIDGTQYIVVTMYPEDDAKLNDLNFTLEIVAGEDDVAGSGTMTIDISHATITLSEADGGGTYDFGDAIEDKDDVHIEYVDSDAPIAVDLDGDGVEYINIDSGVVFTDQATGESVSTAWVAPDDGMLVIDANNSGTVDETREYVFTEWSETAETDLQAVAEVFDTNQDGVLDAQDEQWDQFAIWQDADSDGVTDEGELVPLSELGIESISLTYNEDSESGTAADGDVVIHGQSTVTFTDGSTTIAEDASFVVSAGDVLSDDDTVEIPAAGEDGQAATSQESTASQTGGERSGYDADLLEADLMTSGNSTEKLDTPEQ